MSFLCLTLFIYCAIVVVVAVADDDDDVVVVNDTDDDGDFAKTIGNTGLFKGCFQVKD